MSCVLRALAVLLLAWSTLVSAHRPSDAFLDLELRERRLSGQWEVALRDLAVLTPLDRDRNRELTWGELRAARAPLEAILAAHLDLRADGAACPLRFDDLLIHDRSDGPYAWFALSAECPTPPRRIELGYRLLFDIDPTHRGIVVLRAGGLTHTAVLGPEASPRGFDLARPSRSEAFFDYLREGVWHIWIGYDHILFLLALLLPAVLIHGAGGWRGQARLGDALRDVIAVVTAFTLAHSVTLSLAALDLVRLPSAAVEAAIAASVLLAALNNLWPRVTRARWAMALGFGLIHGFGFASVLGELGLPSGLRITGLVAFNLGVELGQLAIVLLFVPLAFAVRNTGVYRSGVRVAGSLAVAVLATFWLVQRAAGIGV
jgi:hypothetical protein